MTKSPISRNFSINERTLSRWTRDQVKAIAARQIDTAPVITSAEIVPIATDLDFWDAWPALTCDNCVATLINDEELWFILAAPKFPDPEMRHGHARIHALLRTPQGWRHLGPAMPNNFSPGSREWSGSAVLDPETGALTLFFTAAGRRGETTLSFEQRIFSAEATLRREGQAYRLDRWRNLREAVEIDRSLYTPSDHGFGSVGTIKAFRDPGYFRDPRDGRRYLFFAASGQGASPAFNGVVGAAIEEIRDPHGWRILPPLISADALNNELERPHALYWDDRYYMFWSTQTHVFDPEGPTAPTGLYGMTARSLDAEWTPLNGTGLVFGNPPTAPQQAYSWLVLPDLSVTSFIDQWGDTPRGFGGTFAPFLHLWLDGECAGLAA